MIAQANAFHIPLPDESVHTICTSPPYYGLRKYSGDQGDAPLGLESHPEEHIARMVEIGKELWRILRPDGVLWWNYGDCYATTQNGRPAAEIENDDRTFRDKPFSTAQFAKAGSLMMMPHRVAFALQQDGWIVRQDLVWFKRNPMPESVNGWRFSGKGCDCMTEEREAAIAQAMEEQGTDRHRLKGLLGYDWPADPDCPKCGGTGKLDGASLRKGSWRHTRAHEYVFMVVKGMQYFSNQEAVREALDPASIARISQDNFANQTGGPKDYAKTGQNRNRSARQALEGLAQSGKGRNPRSVLDVPTQPYRGAHYATFPVNLIAPLIRATCPRWACPVCGQGWAAVVDKAQPEISFNEWRKQKADDRTFSDVPDSQKGGSWMQLYYREVYGLESPPPSNVLGYRQTCEHPHTQEEAVPGIVFDPFVGSGTTVKVAKDLLRRGVGIDISMEYLDQQAKVRAGLGTPSNALEDLPLFENLLE